MAHAIVGVVPQSAFCKLETQSNGVVCFQIQSPENQENKWHKIQSRPEGVRTRSTTGVSSSPCARGRLISHPENRANSTLSCVCVYVCVCVSSVVSNPKDCRLPGSYAHGFLGKNTGVPFPFPGDLSDPGIKPGYLLYHLSHQGSLFLPYLCFIQASSGLDEACSR